MLLPPNGILQLSDWWPRSSLTRLDTTLATIISLNQVSQSFSWGHAEKYAGDGPAQRLQGLL